MNSPKLGGDKPRMQQQQAAVGGKLRQNRQSMQLDPSDDEIESSPSQILERVKSDRITQTKPEEDRRRRTIIIEKKNGTYGFTLQSYGIHYKKEQEIEMITYVDYVDYDGPAYRAGMREGDVILSINGTDMEKADHKTLVNFIKNCDSRMRMVVLFEDCVRKVELHIRYIQLQRFLQDKMEELEKLCLRERQLLEGKWKTHSLPARRKASNSDNTVPHQSYSYSRPALSSEDIVNKPEQPTLIYQYLEPHYRAYVLSPQQVQNGEYMVCNQRGCRPPVQDKHHFVIKTPCDSSCKSPHSNGLKSQNSIKRYDKKQERCNPCVKTNTNPDNTSLEAYDLASPCCDPHCVPSARRRSRNHKDHVKQRQEEEHNSYQPRVERKHKQHCHVAPKHRYLNLGAEIVSQCSLHSCTSSEFSNTQVPVESSGASYTTSLSTDTLYWDPPSGSYTTRSNSKTTAKSYQQNPQTYYPPQEEYSQYAKPKSWDNLTTKAFGGYGFGYGFLDTKQKRSQKYPTKVNNEPIYSDRTFRRYVQPKSTESLLSMPKFQKNSCECLETPTTSNHSHFFVDNLPSPVEPRECYYTRRSQRIESNDIIIVSTSSEVTRL